MASKKNAVRGSVVHTRCHACKHEHAFKCTGPASPNTGRQNGRQWLGWIASDCQSPEAEDGRLYLEMYEPYPDIEEFPL